MIETLTAATGFSLSLAIVLALAFAVSCAATWLAMSRLQIYDRPNARSSHETPTPKSGGLAVIGSWAFVLFALYSLGGASALQIDEHVFWGFLAAVVFMCMVALIDDVLGMAAPVKLAFQSLVAMVFAFAIARLDVFAAPGVGEIQLGWAGPLITAFWIVGFMNVFNFMDGVNGIASGVAVIACTALAYLAHGAEANAVFLIATTLAAALAGFMMFNFPRGRIFLGDNGSQPIGLTLAGLAVLGANPPSSPAGAASPIPFLASVLLFLPFIFDVAVTLIHRMIRRQNILKAHNEHMYQILRRAGYPHAHVAAVYFAITAACAVGAVLMQHSARADHVFIVLAYAPAVAALAVFAYVQGMRCGVIEELPDARRRRDDGPKSDELEPGPSAIAHEAAAEAVGRVSA